MALKAADGVFAFIETGDAYGSLVEIGMAQALGIPTKVIFGPDAPRDDMWYAAECGGRRYGAHRDLAEALKAFVAGVQR